MTERNVNKRKWRSRLVAGQRGGWEVLTELCTTARESNVGIRKMPLTIRVKFLKLIPLFVIAPSSNGKTADSGVLLPSLHRARFRHF
jgi:hypothetical protein